MAVANRRNNCFKGSPSNGVSIFSSNSIVSREGLRNSFNIVYVDYELNLGDAFSIKILSSDQQVDTCFTFGVTSCDCSQLDDFVDSHQISLCGSDTACHGINNTITFRDPIFKSPDSTISFRRSENSLIEIYVDGKFNQNMVDYSENNILSFLPTLVPFFILNGGVSVIMYSPTDFQFLGGVIVPRDFEDLIDPPLLAASSSSNSITSNSDEVVTAALKVIDAISDPNLAQAFSKGDKKSNPIDVLRAALTEKIEASCASSKSYQNSIQNLQNNDKKSIGVGTNEKCVDFLLKYDHTCVICYCEPRTHLSLPCYHFAYCEQHAKEIVNRPCAICRKTVNDIHICYYS